MYRVGITKKDGTPLAKNFKTKDECDTWVLELMEKEDIKRAIIINKDNISERWIETF